MKFELFFHYHFENIVCADLLNIYQVFLIFFSFKKEFEVIIFLKSATNQGFSDFKLFRKKKLLALFFGRLINVFF